MSQDTHTGKDSFKEKNVRPGFLEIWKSILRGKTYLRSVMNSALSEYALAPGTVLDLGGGKDPSYFKFLRSNEQSVVINVDKQHGVGKERTIDFEKDALPYETATIDQVLMLNVMEHVYNHSFLAREAHRVLKSGSTLIGFVPFLINYHPDPSDYFRYTHEALKSIFTNVGFREVTIRPLGNGPFAVNFNNLASFMPPLFNGLVWPLYYVLDCLVIAYRPQLRKRFPVGYLFVLKK